MFKREKFGDSARSVAERYLVILLVGGSITVLPYACSLSFPAWGAHTGGHNDLGELGINRGRDDAFYI